MRLDRILFGIGFAFLILAIISFVIVRKEMDAYGIPMGTFTPWAPLLFIAIIIGTVFTTLAYWRKLSSSSEIHR